MTTTARRYFRAALAWSGIFMLATVAIVLATSAPFAPAIIGAVVIAFGLTVVVVLLANARANGGGGGTIIAARILLGVMTAELLIGVLAIFTPFILFSALGAVTVVLLWLGLAAESTARQLAAAKARQAVA